MPYPDIEPEEVRRRGEEIYEARLRKNAEAVGTGKFIVIDVLSGDFEIDADDLAASRRLLARKPGARIWGRRIGFAIVDRIGLRKP
jgi:hypothetical protein